MTGVFREKALAGSIIVASMSGAITAGSSLYMAVVVGAKPIILESVSVFRVAMENIHGALHEGIGFTGGTLAPLGNLDRTTPGEIGAVVTRNVTPTGAPLDPNTAVLVSAVNGGGVGDTPAILKPNTSYILQIQNDAGTTQNSTTTIALSEKS